MKFRCVIIIYLNKFDVNLNIYVFCVYFTDCRSSPSCTFRMVSFDYEKRYSLTRVWSCTRKFVNWDLINQTNKQGSLSVTLYIQIKTTSYCFEASLNHFNQSYLYKGLSKFRAQHYNASLMSRTTKISIDFSGYEE